MLTVDIFMYINNLVDEIHLTCIDFDPCSYKKVLLIEGYGNNLKDLFILW